MKAYLISEYDRYCPENNNGDYFVAGFSTLKAAEDFKNKYTKDCTGLSIREFDLDVVPEHYENDRLRSILVKVIESSEFADEDYSIYSEESNSFVIKVASDKFSALNQLERIDKLSKVFSEVSGQEDFLNYTLEFNPLTLEENRIAEEEDQKEWDKVFAKIKAGRE